MEYLKPEPEYLQLLFLNNNSNMDKQLTDDFLMACKETYIQGITPTDNNGLLNKEYPKLIAIAKEYFDNDSYNEFADFFQEGQYFIALWAAHLILEYGKPNEDLKLKSIEVIKKYSDNPLAPEAAGNERKWLNNYFNA